MQRILFSGWCLLASPVLWAQSQPAAEAATSNGPDSLGSLLTLALGLLAVIALIFGCAWLVKRMNGLSGMNSQAIKIVSVMSVGARERIVLIEVGGTQILVGITANTIRTLHVFDEPVVDGKAGNDSEFAKRLQAMIGRNWGGPSSTSRRDGGGDA
ncbi:flagellar biosynthetic protein FliO [Marinobacter sp. JSM 1782161]|uniref:flagellar biosynthetic protein FliO n=1 Tax=Marinobacter sp. JSM 1782161 TaxID=2685906 RepID=UPI001403D225|nr:flagellar biosynthetic protein FliO [Marinobacter sp. JSM 1782161]